MNVRLLAYLMRERTAMAEQGHVLGFSIMRVSAPRDTPLEVAP